MVLTTDRRDGPNPVWDVKLGDGGLLIYDPDNEDAWLQTDESVPYG